MGEAKRRLQETRAKFLRMIERWDFEPSDWERDTVAAVEQLPAVTVRRYPADALAWMRMKPQECHANCRFMQDEDPNGRVRQITGWLLENDNYVLHSVIDQGDGLCCVTPMLVNAPAVFDFKPDPAIEWREEGEYRVAYRGGQAIEPGVRRDPAKSRREVSIMRERLLSGMNPYEAMKLDLDPR